MIFVFFLWCIILYDTSIREVLCQVIQQNVPCEHCTDATIAIRLLYILYNKQIQIHNSFLISTLSKLTYHQSLEKEKRNSFTPVFLNSPILLNFVNCQVKRRKKKECE
ncbi:hypothetical protein GLYMA_11G076400v4 [Glycine max]|uniref:Secreted protein n=2 Tax=Glycine subgen. Soja TaxID=1462606 RepID=A0A0R0HN21_SOYBN|nr:hypothetical protein JHK85_030984 [Glycine max]KAG4993619.1 hypothetical protein JHK86_030446 [Glycine max]KAH1158061.1 hypothetical protein GYH30_030346 [Glycine max]KRH28789.1 hypothetical protein GLYMA_11G076400v4 [Glycine max]RZB78821.1 hypothetical protein D0Y65_029272 [Glycine soja]